MKGGTNPRQARGRVGGQTGAGLTKRCTTLNTHIYPFRVLIVAAHHEQQERLPNVIKI